MPVLIKVSKVTSPKSLGYGKHYGHVVTTKTMSYQELCKHMAEHNFKKISFEKRRSIMHVMYDAPFS